MTIHTVAHFIESNGYALAFVGAAFEGESVLTLAGLAASRGYLSWQVLIAVGAFGGFLGDQIYFLLGRKFGARILVRFPRLQPAARRVDPLIVRYPHLVVIGVRFAYGLRTVGPIAIGMSRIHWLQFIALNAIGAAIWSACWVAAGYLAGAAIEAALGDLRHVEHIVFGVALALAIVVVVALRLRLHKRAP